MTRFRANIVLDGSNEELPAFDEDFWESFEVRKPTATASATANSSTSNSSSTAAKGSEHQAGSIAAPVDGSADAANEALVIRSVKPCSRCTVTNVDPGSGGTSPETLRTLSRVRAGKHLKVNFGALSSVANS